MGDMGNGSDKYVWHEGDVEPFDTVEEALKAESPYEPGEPAASGPVSP